MAMTNQQQTEAYQFFAIAFGATPGVEYMNQLDEAYSFGLTTQQIVNIYTTKPAFNALYPTFFSAEQFANALIANVVGNSASDEAKAEAKADIVASLNGGMSRGDIIYNVFTNLAAKDASDAMWGNTSVMLANKVAVAKYDTEVLLSQDANQTILNTVTFNPASVDAAKTELAGNGPTPVADRLTVGMDNVIGNGADNLFKAVVGQNPLGQQVNTLGSGDFIDGKGGMDTLMAKVAPGVFAGGSVSMPIQPETTSVEIVKFEAVLGDVTGTDSLIARDQVYVNAKNMTEVQQLWSDHSDADLTVMNLTTKGLTQLSDMTIGMAYTGNADTKWGASDMHVYFDQDYLTPEATSTKPTVQFLAMNEDAYDQAQREGQDPQSFALDGVFFRELQFTLNGTKFDLKPFLGEDPNGTGAEIRSYTEFLAAVQSALVQLKAANPGNAALQTVTATFGDTFTTDANPDTLVLRKGTAIELSVDGLTNGAANTLVVVPKDIEVARAATASVDNNNRYELASVQPSEGGTKLGINVALEKVGLAGDGGELVIGSMNKHEGNVWDAKTTTVDSTTSGIEEFYVTVYGNDGKSSSLAGLHSTNNNLRVVTVATDAAQTGTYANLTIGNSNTDKGAFLRYENALKDVQTFNASAFKGDLTLYAALTSEVTAKYLDLKDVGAPAADNLNFEYTGGTGNDNINLTISADNGAFSGTTTREDFLMNATINGGDGNDHITLAIVGKGSSNWWDQTDTEGLSYGTDNGGARSGSTFSNWYDNQKLNANVRIDGGNGNDTIWTPGSGDVIIDGGAGTDTVYADNTGSKAVWALNVAATLTTMSRYDLNNLQSSANDTYKVFKTDVKVSFLGFEATARIADKNGVASDLDLNQAIKKAINSDATLSKLLVATDGPGNTLVVTSLVDGTVAATDLKVALVAPPVSAISAGEAAQLAGWYGTPGLTEATAQAAISSVVAGFNTVNTKAIGGTYNLGLASVSGSYLNGSDSEHTSDNHITGGLGNDVLVLGTGVHSNDTVAYKGFGNGIDSIVNFDTTWIPAGAPVYSGVTGTAEKISVTFGPSDGTPAAQTITFDGGNVNLSAPATSGVIPAIDVALQFSQQFVGTNWSVSTVADNVVTLVRTPVGNLVTDVVAADFTGTYFGAANGNGSVSVATTQGVDTVTLGTYSTFAVTFTTAGTAAAAAGSFTFDGATVAYAAGDGSLSLANKLAAATFANWTVAKTMSGNDTVVTFTAKAPGATAIGVAGADFDLGTNTIVGTLAGTVGTANVGTPVVTIAPAHAGDGFDYLDFSAYNAEAVYVGGVLVAGVAATAGQSYITLVESATNAGAYTMTQYTEAGATDTVVGVIGVADFGAHQDFVAQNFIL